MREWKGKRVIESNIYIYIERDRKEEREIEGEREIEVEREIERGIERRGERVGWSGGKQRIMIYSQKRCIMRFKKGKNEVYWKPIPLLHSIFHFVSPNILKA